MPRVPAASAKWPDQNSGLINPATKEKSIHEEPAQSAADRQKLPKQSGKSCRSWKCHVAVAIASAQRAANSAVCPIPAGVLI